MTAKNNPKSTTNRDPLVERLVSFGLSAVESEIYHYLLKRGQESGGSNIAVGINAPRQYIYTALPHLIELGLIEEVPRGKQSRYRARPPIEIEKIGRKKALTASDLARDLNVISNIGNEQDFEVVQGEKAIQSFELNHAEQVAENSDEYIIGGASDAFSELMGDSLEDYLAVKQKKNVKVKYLGGPSEVEQYTKSIGTYNNQEFRSLKKLPEGLTHLVIRPDSVCFYSFLKPPLVYVVKSGLVAEHYQKFFMMLWEMGEE